jgi:hypothetical protein
VNRVLAFLAGGVVVLAIMSFAAVAPVRSQNEILASQLDAVQNDAARLLGEAKVLVQSRSYENAQRALNTLFEKQPGSSQALEGRALYAEIETTVQERDRKWEAASGAIRLDWQEAKAAELRAKSEQDRELMEKSLSETLDREWEQAKAAIRSEWEARQI